MAQYPSHDIEHPPIGARIVAVEPESPADDAGFEPGCIVETVDGHAVRDIIDWRWLSADDEMEVGYIDNDGERGVCELWRDPGEGWGFEFSGIVFDEIRQCRNACTFCFMRQLPRGMRPSLYVRDDDYRLSFLAGTFVTLTNITPEDEQRILEQRISPLRVSLQASNPVVRARLIGRHAQHGLDVLDRLLSEGIEFHAQIVLVPGENDGDVLDETLSWAWERPGILSVGIVPLGYTRHQGVFTESFNDPDRARFLIEQISPYQERALAERGRAWVHAADEFYSNAYGDAVSEYVPPASSYGDYEMFEDGIGIIRSFLEEWEEARRTGLTSRLRTALSERGMQAVLVAGCAQREFLDALVQADGLSDVLRPLYVENAYFGGNVDVTGLLVGQDIAHAVHADAASSAGNAAQTLYLVPRIVLNDDGLALDDMAVADMEKAAGTALHVVSLSPLEYFPEIIALAEEQGGR